MVADSCDDGNAWCKDDPYHVDLAQASLNQFVLNGQPVGNMYPDHWNNRQVSWQFIAAPNYTGDISIGAIQGAQPYWPAIAISHLPNGIHGVQYFANGTWANATMDSDQGDDYIIAPTTGAGTAGSQYEIRVTDASGNLVNNGEVYNFSLPSACCRTAARRPTPRSATPRPRRHVTGRRPPPPAAVRRSGLSPTSTSQPASGCTLTSTVTNSWPGGYQLQLTVTNNGTAPLTGWTAGFAFADTAETIASSWNATVSQSGAAGQRQQRRATTARSPVGGSTTFGMVVTGGNPVLSRLTCSLG